VDINMGCPDKGIERQGCGAAMIKNPAQAKAVIEAAKRGAPNLPISVKTRLGYNKDELETWLPELLSTGLAAITIHARTRKEMSKVPARWDRVKRAVEIRNESGKDTLIIGNGDALDIADAKAKAEASGCDGVMLGRAIFGNPWLFQPLPSSPLIKGEVPEAEGFQKRGTRASEIFPINEFQIEPIPARFAASSLALELKRIPPTMPFATLCPRVSVAETTVSRALASPSAVRVTT
jgi:tRNA-dihydrouridine synthase